MQTTSGRQYCDFLAINLAPEAAFGPRGEFLEPELGVIAGVLSIDPAVAQGDLESLVVGHGGDPRVFLGVDGFMPLG